MVLEVAFEIDDEAREIMYETLVSDERIPDEVIEAQLQESYVQQLQTLYDNREDFAQQLQQRLESS